MNLTRNLFWAKYQAFKTRLETSWERIHAPMSSTTFKPFTGTDGNYGDASLEYESDKQQWVVHSYIYQLDVRGYGVDLDDFAWAGRSMAVTWLSWSR